MRIIGFTQQNRTFEAFQDCMDALKELGHEVRVYTFSSKDGSSGQAPLKDLTQELLSFSPDFAFVINHMYLPSELLGRLKIPYASFFMDNPFYRVTKEDLRRSVSELSSIFSWDKAYITELKNFGFRNVFYLPLGTNPRVFKKIELGDDEKDRFGCNISFAGRSGYPHYEKYKELTQDLTFKGIFDKVVDELSESPTLDVRRLLNDALSNRNLKILYEDEDKERLLYITLEYAAMSIYRRRILECVAELGCCVYGEESWREAIGSSGVVYLGHANRNRDLPKLYNASKINLNITMPQLKTAVPFRVFDVTACGGFLLTDFREDLKTLFDVEREVVVYKDPNDLREKARYFLDHPEEREKIAERARTRTLQNHTYLKRMEEITEIMRGLYG